MGDFNPYIIGGASLSRVNIEVEGSIEICPQSNFGHLRLNHRHLDVNTPSRRDLSNELQIIPIGEVVEKQPLCYCKRRE